MSQNFKMMDISLLQKRMAVMLQDRLNRGLANVYRNSDGVLVRETSKGIEPLGRNDAMAAE